MGYYIVTICCNHSCNLFLDVRFSDVLEPKLSTRGGGTRICEARDYRVFLGKLPWRRGVERQMLFKEAPILSRFLPACSLPTIAKLVLSFFEW